MDDKQIKKVFKDSTYIIVDSREKDPHIKEALEKFGIKYKVSKMNYGDYGIEIEKNEELGIEETIRLSVSVERKMGLGEIGGNLTKGKKRFEREMKRCLDDDGFMIILIENNTYGDIIDGNYPNDITPKQFLGLLHSISTRYRVGFIFLNKSDSPLFIYDTLKYYARDFLKNK